MEQQRVPAAAAAAAEVPAGLGLTAAEYAQLLPTVEAYHRQYAVEPGRCSSLVAQRIKAPAAAVWAIVRRFDCPQVYKTFIRSCELLPDAEARDELHPGRVREVNVVPGLPAETSTERLDLLDDARRAIGFTVIGGEQGLKNYRSVTTVSELEPSPAATAEICTVVLESYVVDVPDGSSEEETRLLADAIVGVNLQKLKSVVQEENGSAGGWGRRLRAVVVRFLGTLCACGVRGK